MEGSAPQDRLRTCLAEWQAEIERLIAAEHVRPVPDEALIRRLTRERMLARNRLGALPGQAMPL